jgi:Rod binding domain-containing protein
MAGSVGAPLAAGSAPGFAAPGAALTPEQIEKTRKSAQEFEAMAIGQLLQPMFNTVDTSKGLFGGGKGEATWKPMMIDEMAKMLAKSGGIGIADSVMKEMLRIQEGKNAGE